MAVGQTAVVRKQQEAAVISRLEQAETMATHATTPREAKAAIDAFQSIREVVQRFGLEFAHQQRAAEGALRAARRGGELLLDSGIGSGRKGCKLQPLGIDKTQSHRWQRIASLPTDVFEQFIASNIEREREITQAAALKLAKQSLAKNGTEEQPVHEDVTDDLAGLIADGPKFGCVYADPPWQYGNQGTRAATDNHYRTMPLDDICALPIADIAADDAHLHLWTTNAFLFDAKRVMEAWGFEYKSVMLWVKPQLGIGNYWRVSHEFLLLGTRGNAKFRDRSIKSWVEVERGKHSAKPEVFRSLIERVSPGPYIELFSRQQYPGWTVWGNQVESHLYAKPV